MSFRIRYGNRCIIWISLIFIFAIGDIDAQNTKKKTIRSKIEYFKDQDQIGRLVTTLKVKEDRNAPLEGVLVHFYSIGDTSKIFFDSISTNKEGQAIFVLNESSNIYKDSLGLMTFESEYLGNQEYLSATSNIRVQTVELSLSFFQKDTVKYISAEVNEIRLDDAIVPVNGVDVFIYIQGTFSLLNIGDAETNHEGKAIFEFPVEMPGDTNGLLTIVSKIEDHDLYGNLESKGKINWGKPILLTPEKHRGLGDTDAPLWMVYTLIVLLSAVWFHYFYIILMIIKIKLSRTKIPPVQELIL